MYLRHILGFDIKQVRTTLSTAIKTKNVLLSYNEPQEAEKLCVQIMERLMQLENIYWCTVYFL